MEGDTEVGDVTGVDKNVAVDIWEVGDADGI